MQLSRISAPQKKTDSKTEYLSVLDNEFWFEISNELNFS